MKSLWGVVVACTLAVMLAANPAFAQKLDKVRFGTNWAPQPEHGGFYQAVADGTYRKYGLDVTIVPGGPSVNNEILLAAGRLDFYMSGSTLKGFDAVANGIPIVQVAAMFQKDPAIMMAHPGQGIDSLADLNKLTLYLAPEAVATYFQWMKAKYGLSAGQVRPYTFNPQPFLRDKRSAQQGYVSSEPYTIARIGGFKPKVFLLADEGYDPYSTLIQTHRRLIDTKPDLVQRFVDASIIGWYNYIYGDNKAANALIKQGNPEMNDGLIAYAVATMRARGIVDSGEALTAGIGAMSDARVKHFYDTMVKVGVVKAGLDYRKAYTLQFVNKKVGIDLRPKP